MKLIECAKCDGIVRVDEHADLFCRCGNKIVGRCEIHQVVYDLNVLPACPVCNKTGLGKSSLLRLEQIQKENEAWAIVVATDMVRMKRTREPKEKPPENQQEIPSEQFYALAVAEKHLSLSDVSSMVGD